MHYLVTGAAGELALELNRQLTVGGHQVTGLIDRPSHVQRVTESGAEPVITDFNNRYDLEKAIYESGAKIILNLASQWSNTLLHDGHAWRDCESISQQTAALLAAANDNDVTYLLHASYAFLYGPAPKGEQKAVDESTPLRPPAKNPLFSAAIEAEKLVVANEAFPVCLLRTGYLYGPQSKDLALYETSFKLHRPYYAGSKKHVGNFVHFNDAARAVMLAAEKQPANEIVNIVDGTPVSFGTFIDSYAKLLGYKKPRHIHKTLIRLAPYFITPQQVKQLDIQGAQVDNHKARELLGWTPQFPNYKVGLAQTVRVLHEES